MSSFLYPLPHVYSDPYPTPPTPYPLSLRRPCSHRRRVSVPHDILSSVGTHPFSSTGNMYSVCVCDVRHEINMYTWLDKPGVNLRWPAYINTIVFRRVAPLSYVIYWIELDFVSFHLFVHISEKIMWAIKMWIKLVVAYKYTNIIAK